MRSPVEFIQEALSARFTTEFAGKPLAGKVYNYVPKGTALPYLFIDSWELSPNTEVKGSNGSPFAVVGTLHVYSNTKNASS